MARGCRAPRRDGREREKCGAAVATPSAITMP